MHPVKEPTFHCIGMNNVEMHLRAHIETDIEAMTIAHTSYLLHESRGLPWLTTIRSSED
jgi:hypothetical protein